MFTLISIINKRKKHVFKNGFMAVFLLFRFAQFKNFPYLCGVKQKNTQPMPYKSEKAKLPRELKRTVKLSEEERDEIRLIRRLHNHSYNELARAYGVSKRLVIFICNPDTEKKCRERRREFGADGRYYDREKHNESVKRLRKYKNELFKDGVISIC